ncbi:glycosyltransferase [Corynebacterium hadale]|uniref:glycosyltransferase n=1 Tax=Corynebacterium hadale TaxID=2026255 RepID=UPI000BAA92AB|nr:glycosyltransferase [Corynebacterium hadale]PAT13591.1 glycosyl transferase [Corynebacterium hadale]
MTSIIVYGDISPNVVDGSSIWLMSVTETLAKVFDRVHLQLKFNPENDRLLKPLQAIANVSVHVPPAGLDEVTIQDAPAVLEDLVAEVNAEVVLSRGLELANALCKSSRISRILWPYITDLPFPLEKISATNVGRLQRIALRAKRVFVQTEAARSYLEAIAPHAAGKTLLMLPMIPDEAFVRSKEKTKEISSENEKLRLVYAGKLAKDWKTLEMLDIPIELRRLGIESELVVVGDKINRDRKDPSWATKMREKLELVSNDPNSGVRWLGGMPRAEAMKQIAMADLGIGWRTDLLDSSLEISTKALEYSALGTPAVVNLNDDALALFGDEYPFFVAGDASAKEMAESIASGLSAIGNASEYVPQVVRTYSMESAASRLYSYFESAGVFLNGAGRDSKDKIHVVIASHDFKFMGELLELLREHPQFEVRKDEWKSLHDHDVEKSAELLRWADVVFCEWAGPSVKWYAEHKMSNQRLIARLHGFELRGPAPWMREINWDHVDELVFVSQHYERLAKNTLPLSATSTRVITNIVDAVDFDRPKMPGAQYHLALVGIVPFLKRPDRALRFLKDLLDVDENYYLHIRGRAPWEYPYEWRKPLQKQMYLEFYSLLASDQKLKEHVVFEPFGPDMASWYRKIGIVLSTSELESFHLAPAEGMSSRAVPVVWEREGAKEIFGHYVDGGTDLALERILALREQTLFVEAGEKAREYSLRWDKPSVFGEWLDVLVPGTKMKM